MTLGERLIVEIARLGPRGVCFDYQAYRILRGIDARDALQAFLAERGYRGLEASPDPAEVAREMTGFAPCLLDVPLWTFAVGTALGLVAVAFAMAMLPATADSYTEVNRLVLESLGILFPLLVGFWVGYVQRSLRGMFLGVAAGAALGGMACFLATHSLRAAGLFFPLVLALLTMHALRCGRTVWREETVSRIVKAAIIFGCAGIGAMAIFGIAVTLRELQSSKATLPQYRQALWLLGVACSPLAGGVLLLVHWTLGLRHPRGGPRLALRASYRHTIGLDRVAEKPREVWTALQRCILKEDGHVRRWDAAWTMLFVLFVLVFVQLGMRESWKAWLVRGLPSHLAVTVCNVIQWGWLLIYGVVLASFQAVRIRRINARVAEELQKYPDPVTLDQVTASGNTPFQAQAPS